MLVNILLHTEIGGVDVVKKWVIDYVIALETRRWGACTSKVQTAEREYGSPSATKSD
jgi:hypothetical protein